MIAPLGEMIAELQRIIAGPDGLRTIPVSDEALRPLLDIFFEISAKHGPAEGLVMFDAENIDTPADKILVGAPVFITQINAMMEAYTERIQAVLDASGEPTRAALTCISPELVVAYCPKLWIPAAALGSARH